MTPELETIRGYTAAFKQINALLDKAQKRLPKCGISEGVRKRADFKQGYYAGLLAAHCFSAYGEYPRQNEEQINKILDGS